MTKRFSLQAKTEKTMRLGSLRTKNGVLETPFFMPDATRASVRGVSTSDIAASGINAVVVNTYHLMLQPGAEFMRKNNGVHAFMGWQRPVLSDSGGYQVYSLIHKNPEFGRITEDGAEFRSVLDGSKHLLTPERAIQIQFDLGVDMMVCLDDPRPNDVSHEEMVLSVERTIRWAKRCRGEYDRQVAERKFDDETRPLLFGVVQGGTDIELRKQCAKALVEIGFDGYGFGGRHIDAEGAFLEDVIRETAVAIPEDTLRFALGIGTPEDIVRCHALGWDMFDCVIPTREGRHGRLFVMTDEQRIFNFQFSIFNQASISNDQVLSPDVIASEAKQSPNGIFYETININNERYKEDFSPVDETCDCELCKNYTKAYLRHLFRVEDPLAGRLATLHNLRFYARLMEGIRENK